MVACPEVAGCELPDCSVPLIATEAKAFVAAAPGLGSITFTSLPSASEHAWRFFPDSSVAVVHTSGARTLSSGVSSYLTDVTLPSCLVVFRVRLSASYMVWDTQSEGWLVRKWGLVNV